MFLTNALFQRVDLNNQAYLVMHKIALDSFTANILSINFKEKVNQFVSQDKAGGFRIPIKTTAVY